MAWCSLTGSGGEIRDEGRQAVGQNLKAGLVGFSVSNLRIPGFEQPWEERFWQDQNVLSVHWTL